MASNRCARRREKLIRRIRSSQAEALLVTGTMNVRYLTGFTGDSSYLLIGPEVTVLLSDSRFESQIREECPELETSIRSNRQTMAAAAATVIDRAGLQKVGFESGLHYGQWEKIQGEVKRAELLHVPGLVEELRQVKDAEEINLLRQAVHQAEQGFALLQASLIPEMSERQAAHDVEHAMRRFGAERASFEPIVAVGPRSALPHARPTTGQIQLGNFVLIDWGASHPSGYKSDLTRVLVPGKISPKLERIYGVVLNAQRRGIEAIRPGAACRDVDKAAREVIAEAGYGKYFGHGLGHGIGLDIHEGPRLSPIAEDKLKAGMVVTVEPGIYLPGWGGVRIEDDVLVTRDGCEVLTSVPKEWDQVLNP